MENQLANIFSKRVVLSIEELKTILQTNWTQPDDIGCNRLGGWVENSSIGRELRVRPGIRRHRHHQTRKPLRAYALRGFESLSLRQ